MAPTTRSSTRQADSPLPSPTSFYDAPPSLLNIVRRANARYSHIATSMRNTLDKARPSHARKRAALLNLTVNTDVARKLEQKHVSVVPLPILELGPSPTTYAAPAKSEEVTTQPIIHAPQPKRPSLKCVIPARPRPQVEQQVPSSIASASVSAISSSVSAFATISLTTIKIPEYSPGDNVPSSTEGEQSIPYAPASLRARSIPWRPVTSRWSISTAGEGESDCEMDITSEGEPSPLVLEVPIRPMAPLPGSQRKHTRSYAMQFNRSSSPIQRHAQRSQNYNAEPIHLHVSIGKRKTSCDSTASAQDSTSPCTSAESPVEKRPKYMRKSWVRRKSSAFSVVYNERGAF